MTPEILDEVIEAIEGAAFQPGEWAEFKHIEYCRYCHYSRAWIAENGHRSGCALGRLKAERATFTSSAGTTDEAHAAPSTNSPEVSSKLVIGSRETVTP